MTATAVHSHALRRESADTSPEPRLAPPLVHLKSAWRLRGPLGRGAIRTGPPDNRRATGLRRPDRASRNERHTDWHALARTKLRGLGSTNLGMLVQVGAATMLLDNERK